MRGFIVTALVLTSVLAAAGLATDVEAHGGFDRSEPIPNAVLSERPAGVDVWFTQEVFKQEGANFVRVFNQQNVQVSEGDGVVDDDDRTHISVALPPALGDGRYIVRWKTTSDLDQDTLEGAFCFYIGVEPTAEQEGECAALDHEAGLDDDDDGVSTATIVIGAVAVVAVLLIAGGGLAIWRRSSAPS